MVVVVVVVARRMINLVWKLSSNYQRQYQFLSYEKNTELTHLPQGYRQHLSAANSKHIVLKLRITPLSISPYIHFQHISECISYIQLDRGTAL